MKQILWAVCLGLIIICSNAHAQVSPDTLGMYTGKASITSYLASTPVKNKTSMSLEFFQNTVLLGAPDDSGTYIYYSGSAAQIGPNVFVSIQLEDGFSLKGRLAIKGKPGKQSLQGKMSYLLGEYIGYLDLDIKLKQLPQ